MTSFRVLTVYYCYLFFFRRRNRPCLIRIHKKCRRRTPVDAIYLKYTAWSRFFPIEHVLSIMTYVRRRRRRHYYYACDDDALFISLYIYIQRCLRGCRIFNAILRTVLSVSVRRPCIRTVHIYRLRIRIRTSGGREEPSRSWRCSLDERVARCTPETTACARL